MSATESMRDEIPKRPVMAYQPAAAGRLLAAARSYLDHGDRLVYSFGSRTFLSGYDIFDGERRGYIDCSTFVLLVLAGISYRESPYATGTAEGLRARPGFGAAAEQDRVLELFDFSDLPKAYVGIAERIGRPYLAGPKGLDLKRAAELGIGMDTLGEEIRRSGGRRRSEQIARYYLDRGGCFSDPSCLRPGDLVFYLSSGFFTEGDEAFPAEKTVNHVGIVSEDTAVMINSTGLVPADEGGQETEVRPGVSLTAVFGRRIPAFFARPYS